MTGTTEEPASPWGEPRPESNEATSAYLDTPVGSHHLSIVFQGSGSEYFRIWVVNLLLTVVTLGLYYPWAKVRRLRYFYGNTFIGDHALDFHGDPKLMLRGFLLAAVMGISYSVAGRVSPLAGLIALLVIAVLWPALFWTSQRFRLANTSWRGLRFRFSGDLKSSYRAMLPLFVPGVLFFGAGVIANWSDSGRPRTPGIAQLVFLPVIALLLPWAFWSVKRYQHGHFNLGQIRTELKTGVGSFYGLALKFAAIALSLPFIGGIVAALLVAAASHRNSTGPNVSWFIGFIILSYAVAFLVGQPFLSSRAQNLVWGRTVSHELRFQSALRFWPLLRLTLLNALLIVLSLGFYAPFARIATARMRLQAVTVESTLAPDQLVASVHDRAQPDATGDAAGDLFGFDIGW